MQKHGHHDLGHRAPQVRVASEMRIGSAPEMGQEPSRVRHEQDESRGRGDGAPEPAPLPDGKPDSQADDGYGRVLPGSEGEKDTRWLLPHFRGAPYPHLGRYAHL